MDYRMPPQRTVELAQLTVALIADLRDPDREPRSSTMPADFDALHEAAKASAWLWISNPSGVVRPTCRMYRDPGRIVEVIVPGLEEDDLAFAAAMALVVRMAKVDGYFITMEVWLSRPHPDTAVDALKPSERSDRMEALAVSVGLRGRHSVKLYPILRAADGSCCGFDAALAAQPKFEHRMLMNLYEPAELHHV